MNNKKLFLYLFLGSFLLSQKTFCMIAPVNFYQQHYSMLKRTNIDGAKISGGVLVETGSKGYARDFNKIRRNALQIYDQSHNVETMFTNYENPISYLPNIKTATIKDFANGKIDFAGSFSGTDITFYKTFKPFSSFKQIPGIISLDFLLPIKHRRIKNINIKQTGTLTSNEAKAFMEIFEKNMHLVGIDLSSTDLTGIGDFTALLNWEKDFDFREDQKYFKDICCFCKAGFIFPTSPKKHADKVFAMPLGNDGHFGIPFGLGISVDIVEKCKVGVTFDFLKQNKKTKMMRVKTHEDQGEFLLLNKASVRRDPGFTWQFNPYISLHRFDNGISFKLAYQYQSHNSDKLSMSDQGALVKKINTAVKTTGLTDEKLNDVINSANSLKKWDVKNIILQVNWDFEESVKDCPGAPQLSVFYKRALSAKNIIDSDTFGLQFTFNF